MSKNKKTNASRSNAKPEMTHEHVSKLKEIVLAPYIREAYVLSEYDRRVGGNMFRHSLATMTILLDYHYIDPVLLKTAIVHDLFEDVPETDRDHIKQLDSDGPTVVKLALEVTKREGETKMDYLHRVFEQESNEARIIKLADRISNLTDLHRFIFRKSDIKRYISETEYIIQVGHKTNPRMNRELEVLLEVRKKMVQSAMLNTIKSIIPASFSGS